MTTSKNIEQAYRLAKEQYAEYGINTDDAIAKMNHIAISLHCWQADDVGGFEHDDSKLEGGGIQVTGNYPGKARNIREVQDDLDKAMALIPGKQRLNLHAIYGDFSKKKADRDQVDTTHFENWINWAAERGMGLDFNATCFSHPLADSGFTLSSKDKNVRKFWIAHVQQCRKIAEEMGKRLNKACVHNLWIPDGSKDMPLDRNRHRELLLESLNEIIAVKYDKKFMKDSFESKLFGIGSESMVVGSHELYMGFAIKNNTLLCLDNGHFHPTEQVGDKISSVLLYLEEVLLHMTRGIRWDSDHVTTWNEDIQLIASEIVRNNFLHRVNIGLDFFDASINRIGAYVVGTRAVQQAFLNALLEPVSLIRELEEKGKNFQRLAMLEVMKSRLFGAVWDYYCEKENVPVGAAFIGDIEKYEREVLGKRK